MASYWAYTSTGTNYWIYLIVENVDQDTANNRSKVRYKAYLEGASSTSSWGTGSYTVTINGASTSGSIQYDFSSAKKWYCIGSDSGYRTSGYISHNNDGTKSITVSFNFSGASLVGSATISETFTLNTIPRASDVAVSNYTVANTTGSLSATITSRANFYHRWRWKVGSGSWSGWNNKGLISTTSSTVTVSNSNLLSRMPSDKNATFTIEVATYSDSNYANYVGTKSASATLTVTIKPSVSLGNIAINTSPISGYAVAGYSTVKATWSATAGSGASNGTTYFTISTGSLTASSSTASSGTVTSTTIPGSANNYTLTITAYTVDSRGLRSDNVSKSITVYGYQPPTATLSAYRVANSTSTTEDGAGVYVYVTFSGAVRSSVNNQNSIQSTTCTYSGSISGTATNGQHIALADSQSATFTLTVRDKMTSSTAIVSVAPALYPLDLYDNGQGTVGVGFGTTAERSKVKSALPMDINGNVITTNGYIWSKNGSIYAGDDTLANNTTERRVVVYGGAGQMALYSQPSSTGNRGLWLDAHGTGGGKNAFTIDTNNNVTFYGTINGLVDMVYPVGSIYMSVNSTSPATLFGGTWEQIKGRFLLGTGTPDDNSNTYYGSDLTYNGSTKYNEQVGSTGGESRHTLSVAEMPSHTHSIYYYNSSGSLSFGYNFGNKGSASAVTTASSGIGVTGGDASHNNLPPYFVVYMWKRTA